ncbi:hypothetical protein MKW92_030431 [Papaver armeniacum]|nr:hypothetical protein MKW92_030431 [Papaver armeniacum]
MGGGMEVNKNTHIEDWNAFRENLEHKFRWNRRNFAIIGLFGIHMQDEDYGRPYKKYGL